MTQPVSTIALENFEGINSEEDILITDVSRPPGSAREKQQYEKWKQNLRIELIREHFEVQKKNKAARKPVLLQMLDSSKKDR